MQKRQQTKAIECFFTCVAWLKAYTVPSGRLGRVGPERKQGHAFHVDSGFSQRATKQSQKKRKVQCTVLLQVWQPRAHSTRLQNTGVLCTTRHKSHGISNCKNQGFNPFMDKQPYRHCDNHLHKQHRGSTISSVHTGFFIGAITSTIASMEQPKASEIMIDCEEATHVAPLWFGEHTAELHTLSVQNTVHQI